MMERWVGLDAHGGRQSKTPLRGRSAKAGESPRHGGKNAPMVRRPVIWRPQEKQALFLARPEDEALYGGAAGGGKSDALVMEALRQIDKPYYKGLILRKTFPQLGELVDKSLRYYPLADAGAVYNASTHTWRFSSGAKVIFGSLGHPRDKYNYQGQAYDFIAFDELTQFSFEEYSYLFSRNRPNGPGTRCYIRATANPGGVGHGWVKERFITPAPPMTTLWDSVKIRFPDGREEMRHRSRIFVPSTVFDNRILLEHDPDYITRLASLPEAERKALLYGDWDSFSGQVFTEWRNDPAHHGDRRWSHVIAPFRIPASWTVWRGFDWGYTRPFSVGWYAVDHDGRLYRIRELYGCRSDGNGMAVPNEGVRRNADEIARDIRRIEREDPNLRGRRIYGVADPAIYQRNGGASIGELMEAEGVYWDRADNTRLAGKQQMHNRLSFDEEGLAGLYVFSTCRHFIRTIPALVYSQMDVEDVDTAGEDHIYDECRYVCMANPCAAPLTPLNNFDFFDAPPKLDYAARVRVRG